MQLAIAVVAEASPIIHYKLARLQAVTESGWWHWLALVVAVLAVLAFVLWMYRKDSVELPRGLAILLCTLRLLAFAGILFYFFGLEKRAERKAQALGLCQAPTVAAQHGHSLHSTGGVFGAPPVRGKGWSPPIQT